jgi:rod shape-determining protein MreD
MKKKFLYLLVIFIALILQTATVAVFFGERNAVDLVLMLALAWAIIDGFGAFFFWAIAIGILYDLAAFTPVGVHVLIFLAVIYMVSFFSRRLSIDHKGTGAGIIFVFIIVATFISQGILGILSHADFLTVKEFFKIFVSIKWFAVQIFFNSVFFILAFILVNWVKKYFAINN